MGKPFPGPLPVTEGRPLTVKILGAHPQVSMGQCVKCSAFSDNEHISYYFKFPYGFLSTDSVLKASLPFLCS